MMEYNIESIVVVSVAFLYCDGTKLYTVQYISVSVVNMQLYIDIIDTYPNKICITSNHMDCKKK